MTENKHSRRRRKVGLLVAALMMIIGLVAAAPAGATGKYTDPSGDSGSAPDITGVTVSSDKSSGQIIFQISGSNLSSSDNFPTFLDIDSDANPVTGDIVDGGADYSFGVDQSGYGFWHWNGSDWIDTSYSTVQVFVNSGGVMISVNKSEIGNPTDFNFSVTTIDIANKKFDSAPDDGNYNYSLDDGGPLISAITLQTTPAAGPKAGKTFVVAPTGLTLPPSGALLSTSPTPDSYTCTATLKGRSLRGLGTSGCSFNIPKKKSRGKTLKVVVTVNYEGASKSFTYAFRVR
jgi:hypothetical protein